MIRSDNARGALLMVGCMTAFTFNDAVVKAAAATVPLPQILVLRGIVASAALVAMAWWFGAFRTRVSRRDWRAIALRGMAEAAAAYFFLTALINMPLANVTALLQMLPLTVTLGSALFLGEPVGWRRWLAIAAGFLGMLLIVRPGTEGFTVWSVYALLAVVCVTVRDLIVRRLSPGVPSLLVTLAGSLAVLVFAGVWSLSTDWVAMGTKEAVLIVSAAGLVAIAYLLSVLAVRMGEVSFVAPFRYTALLVALVLGIVVFGEWPAAATLIGAAVIAASGLFTFWRETALRRRARPPNPTASSR